MKDSIEFDEDDSDFGIQNEVDNLVPISSLYGCYLSLFGRQHFKGNEIQFPGYGKWVSNQPIKSLRTAGPCCFRIK